MRPRDIIAFINECIQAADGRSEVLLSDIRRAEVEYSRKRKDALEQEWRSCFPTLGALLNFYGRKRQVSMSLAEFRAEGLDDLALAIYSEGRKELDPLFGHAKTYVENGQDGAPFVRQIAAILYRVGAVGLKVATGDRLIYSHLDEPLINDAILSDKSTIRLQPMLHAAFRLQANDAE